MIFKFLTSGLTHLGWKLELLSQIISFSRNQRFFFVNVWPASSNILKAIKSLLKNLLQFKKLWKTSQKIIKNIHKKIIIEIEWNFE